MKIFYPKYKREELIEKLKRIFIDISKTIKIMDARLFGSCARGTNTAFSDIDIFVVVGDNYGVNVYSICWDMIGIPEIELHIYTEGEIEIMKRTGNSFLREVERDGIKLLTQSP
ncbi:MAG: nucleotidyltransferase domain-containing protein [Thermoplasmataceae archaeon]